MSKWETVRLGDVCQFINGDRGKNYPSSTDFVDTGIPFVNAGHLNDEQISLENMNYITEDKYESLGSGKMQRGDILYCLRGSLGKHAIVNIEKGAIASSLVILRPKNIDGRYLLQLLKTNLIHKQQMVANNGSSQPNLSATSVKSYNIPLPPLETQQKIADVLDRAGALIEKRKAQTEKLDLLIKSQFIEMFGDPVTNPKGWAIKSLDSICDGIGDGLHGTPNYQTDGEISFINGNNLVDGEIIITPATKTVGIIEYEKHYINISNNAILVSINGTLGKLAHYNGEKVVLGKSACYCNLKPPINKKFIYGLMKSDGFQRFLENSSTKSTIKNVGLKAMREFQIIQPPEKLQLEFLAFVERSETQKSQLQQSLEKLELNYKSLMQKCFRGDLF